MGTKVEYSIDVLATLVVDSNNVTVKGVDVWEQHQNKGVSHKNCHRVRTTHYSLQFPIERRKLNQHNIESIKKTMQMHEDIFKHQVGELHRVYNVLKMLMEELKKEIRQKKFWRALNGQGISQKTTQIPYGATYFQAQSFRGDLCSRERSGSCSGEDKPPKKPRNLDLEMPVEEGKLLNDEGEAGPSGSDEEIEVDLTLSIGGSSNMVREKKKKVNACGSYKSDRVGECSDPTTPMSSSSITFEQERREPHWLSQALNFKAGMNRSLNLMDTYTEILWFMH